MNLKSLSLLVAICQTAQIALSLYGMVSHHYFSPLHLTSVALSAPMVLFFFYIWKKQKA